MEISSSGDLHNDDFDFTKGKPIRNEENKQIKKKKIARHIYSCTISPAALFGCLLYSHQWYWPLSLQCAFYSL